MKIVNGVYTSAKIFTDSIEDYALAQIQMLCDNEAIKDCTIRIMPDVHPGKVGTIGFTSTVGKRILPNVVGIDAGCGVTLAKLRQKKTEFGKLDKAGRCADGRVPAGYPGSAGVCQAEPTRYIRRTGKRNEMEDTGADIVCA